MQTPPAHLRQLRLQPPHCSLGGGSGIRRRSGGALGGARARLRGRLALLRGRQLGRQVAQRGRVALRLLRVRGLKQSNSLKPKTLESLPSDCAGRRTQNQSRMSRLCQHVKSSIFEQKTSQRACDTRKPSMKCVSAAPA